MKIEYEQRRIDSGHGRLNRSFVFRLLYPYNLYSISKAHPIKPCKLFAISCHHYESRCINCSTVFNSKNASKIFGESKMSKKVPTWFITLIIAFRDVTAKFYWMGLMILFSFNFHSIEWKFNRSFLTGRLKKVYESTQCPKYNFLIKLKRRKKKFLKV